MVNWTQMRLIEGHPPQHSAGLSWGPPLCGGAGREGAGVLPLQTNLSIISEQAFDEVAIVTNDNR